MDSLVSCYIVRDNGDKTAVISYDYIIKIVRQRLGVNVKNIVLESKERRAKHD